MEQCACVERELEKVLHRFVMYGHQSEERLDELLRSVCEIRGQLVAFGKTSLSTMSEINCGAVYFNVSCQFKYNLVFFFNKS